MNWESQLGQAIEREPTTEALGPRALTARNLCRQQQYGKALEVLWSMLRRARKGESPRQEAFVLIHIGKVYRHWIWDVALKFFHDGWSVARQCGFVRGEMIAANAIGEIYYAWEKYDEALKYFQQSLELAKGMSDMSNQRDILLDMVECYGELGEFSTCDELLHEAHKLDGELGLAGQVNGLQLLESETKESRH